MVELKKFLEREFLRIRTQQKIVQKQTEIKNDVSAIRLELAQPKRIPENRGFPVGKKEDLDKVRRKLRAQDTKEKLVDEIDYVLERDEVVQEWREAKMIHEMNFIQYVIRNITQTSETAFTAMVSASKSLPKRGKGEPQETGQEAICPICIPTIFH